MTWLTGLLAVQLLHTVSGQYLNCGKTWEQGGMMIASSNVTTTANFSPSASGYFQKKGSRISRRSFQGSSSKAKDMRLSLHGWEDSLYKELSLLNNTPSLSFFHVLVCPDSPRSIIVLKQCMLGRSLGIRIASSRHVVLIGRLQTWSICCSSTSTGLTLSSPSWHSRTSPTRSRALHQRNRLR